jgi:caffeoyl-CoA O-methyltransferase
MSIINEKLFEYAIENSDSPSILLNNLEKETNQKILQPRMISGAFQGRLLSLISKLVRPNKIIEIGTFTGYATLCLAEGLMENGEIHTIDNNEELVNIQKKYFDQSIFKSKIKQYLGTAIEILPKINGPFDIAFIDADKVNYNKYFEIIYPKMRKGGVIISDNVLWNGKVLRKLNSKDLETKSIREFNHKLKKDIRVKTLLIPIRDGISISQVC